MLKDLLEDKKCFKLVCGAGNEDAIEVEKLVALYSAAGCNFFDLCAREDIVDAAKKGIDFSIKKEVQKDYYLCVSVGINGDPHISKAEIDKKNCIKCKICKKICPQHCTRKDKKRCIGCAKCVKACPMGCISLVSQNMDLAEILPPLIVKGINCIELHTTGEDEAEIDEKWAYLNANFSGILSVNVDRSKSGDEKLLARVKRLLAVRQPFSTIIQSDGIAMSGDTNDFKTTLQSVSITEYFYNKNLSAYIIASGGTNAKTRELLNLCEVYPNGVAIGTFARLIVQKYTEREDFLTNSDVFDQALKIAKTLVDTTLERE